ncbi:BspA family leucine-rich repeat surface protein, partial [Streptomyces caeruleatus]
QPLNWDTSNVITMSKMFEGAKNFNQPLIWNTINVTNMSGMFCSAKNFSQNISNLFISSIDFSNFIKFTKLEKILIEKS